ncbi:nitrogen regulation protein NR(I) [Vogesella fluminis]|uniref:DNA-binding transcriptional regulator NtrC n=1 Tax=Vogesella fluminis TaxID=1069161 RepID=A0ABQ3H8X6_9NEIS|nr:nitrogen regulation protein NR(I) [Vogesella fluminis]GHD71822.1 nitrogen regulation protein NR(I) [Vogesella fluminis]
MTQAVWIIDDDKAIRWVLEKSLARSGIAYQSFSSADDALNALYDACPSVIISDIRMPGTDGLKFLGKVKQEHPALPVIIMTAHSDLDSAVAAFQGGAFEYLPKPFDVDQAVALIERALAESRSSEAASEDAEAMPALLGQAPAMQDVFRAIGRLSQSSVTVLITGESGTGKERVAEALHRHSVRSAKPFIALNTAAIPKDLLESELFGHEKGAFTGALGTRRGRFEEAEGGTLFLDEIGDMPTELQTRLLRVLSDGHFYRVGGHTPIKANVRVIAATHQHLEERVKLGQFREDLFHRLNVIRLRLPPLRERNEDIPLLVRHFLARSAANLGVEPKRLSEAAMALVQHYAFPGNVRQLENLCQWITVMAPGQSVEMQDLPPEFRPELIAGSGGTIELPLAAEGGPAPQPAGDWTMLLAREVAQRLAAGETGIIDDLTARFESTCIRSGLAHTGGRKVEAANLLGWGRNTLTRKIQELGLEHGGD